MQITFKFMQYLEHAHNKTRHHKEKIIIKGEGGVHGSKIIFQNTCKPKICVLMVNDSETNLYYPKINYWLPNFQSGNMYDTQFLKVFKK